MARIHPAWHDRFLQDLHELVARHGFERTRVEGNLLFCVQYDREGLTREGPTREGLTREDHTREKSDAALILEATRAIVSFMQDHGEYLLDFATVLDYERHRNEDAAYERLVRYLSAIRNSNALYVTNTVFSALEPVIRTATSGVLRRVIAFCSDNDLAAYSYRDATFQRESAVGIRETVAAATHYRGAWIYGRDRSILTATVEEALRNETGSTITVQCTPGMTRREFLSALIRVVPDVPAFTMSETEAAFDLTLMTLRDKMRDPAGWYLSSGSLEEEQQLVARYVLHRYLRSESRRPLLIADYDTRGEDAPDMLAWIPETTPGCPVLVTAAIPPSDNRWVPYHLEESDTEVDGPNSGAYAAVNLFWGRCGLGGSTSLVRPLLGDNHRRVLVILNRVRDLLCPSMLDELLLSMGITIVERARLFSDLQHLGLVTATDPIAVHPAVAELVPEIAPHGEVQDLEQTLARFLLDRVRAGSLPVTERILDAIGNAPPRRELEELRHNMGHLMAAGGDFAGVQRLSARASLPATPASARIRLFLRDSRGPTTCEADTHLLREVISSGQGIPEREADYLLSIGEYELARRNFQAALDAGKRAILLTQDMPVKHPAGRSRRGAGELLMARVFLAQRRMREATQYLGFAREDAGDDRTTYLMARVYGAIRLMLVGNLTRAAQEFHELETTLLENGFTEWVLVCWFALARINFELGQYQEARNGFSFVERYCQETQKPEPALTASAWKNRCDLQESPHDRYAWDSLRALEHSAEIDLFLGETLCRRGEFSQALTLLQSACEEESRCDRWPRLGVCWDNGFAPIEDVILADEPGMSELMRIATAYRAWALAETGGMEEAIHLFFSLTRKNGGIGDDPYAGLYNYLYSTILPGERSPDRDDQVTVLGKSVKLVQERTSRIDDYKDKKRFLQSNAWNRLLMATARDHNLV